MDQFFIECVKEHPSLWDTKHPSYRNLKLRDAAWKDVIKKTKIGSVVLAKSKWKNLRDVHREALKNPRKTNSKRWKYMSKMKFLIPHITNRQKETNTPPPEDFSMEADDTASSDYTDNRDNIIVDTVPMPCTVTKVESCADDDGDLIKLYRKIENDREQRTKQREELWQELFSDDPLKSFFDSMYKSTKQMPEPFQRSIKRKLFELVMEAEDNISNSTNCLSSYSPYNPDDCADKSHSSYLINNSSAKAPVGMGPVYCIPKPDGSSSQQPEYGVFVCNKRRDSDSDITPSDNVII